VCRPRSSTTEARVRAVSSGVVEFPPLGSGPFWSLHGTSPRRHHRPAKCSEPRSRPPGPYGHGPDTGTQPLSTCWPLRCARRTSSAAAGVHCEHRATGLGDVVAIDGLTMRYSTGSFREPPGDRELIKPKWRSMQAAEWCSRPRQIEPLGCSFPRLRFCDDAGAPGGRAVHAGNQTVFIDSISS
jgi:hypothetical protein